MPKRNRDDVEQDKKKAKKYIDYGAKSTGRAYNLDTVLEVLLDMRDLMEEIKDKL